MPANGDIVLDNEACLNMSCTDRHVDMKPTVTGDCFGAKLIRESNNHLIAQLLVEDDGNWFTHGDPFDVMWIDDIISVLERMKICIEVHENKNG